jgi:hypothetical protein
VAVGAIEKVPDHDRLLVRIATLTKDFARKVLRIAKRVDLYLFFSDLG